MSALRAVLAALSFVWWAWVASRYSGGGPCHPSYTDAVWRRELARLRLLRELTKDA